MGVPKNCNPLFLTILLAAALSASAAQEIPAQDLGSSGLVQNLAKLKTTARLLHSTAHPDDDDGSMLTYESRGEGATTLMLTLNRGEGGQNRVGSELFDELGILRTLELLEADRYYGVQQRFSRVVDFGFSKNSAETFDKWNGRNAALKDVVRVIREFRPDVIVSRFAGDSTDGHGNHQAAGLLAREAFHAAADPNRFPEQIREGLLPWQVKKLYVGNLRGKEEEFTLRLDTGVYDPVLGMSYWQFSVEGLRHQASQGVGAWSAPSGPNMRGFRLVESVLPAHRPGATVPAATVKEKSFFDGVDTSIAGLAGRIGPEGDKVPFLVPGLNAVQQSVIEASSKFEAGNPARSAPYLLDGLARVAGLMKQVDSSSLSAAAKKDLLVHLRTKSSQFEQAANLALGTELDVTVDSGAKPSPERDTRQEETFLMAVPGQTFTATAKFYNRGSQRLLPRDIALLLPEGWKSERLSGTLKELASSQSVSVQFRITVPTDARFTRPYWQRKDQSQAVYDVLEPEYLTLALPPWPVKAHATYVLAGSSRNGSSGTAVVPGEGSLTAVAQVKVIDPLYGQIQRPLAVAPPVSIEVEPRVQIVSTRTESPVDVSLSLRNHVNGAAEAGVKLDAPPSWKVEPAGEKVSFESEGEYKTLHFRLQPGQLQERQYELKASAVYAGRTYTDGVRTIGRKDIGYAYYYRPAYQRISAVNVEVPKGLRVGYIMGAGDDIPTVLRQIGITVRTITPDELAAGDLSQYDTIVVGIRAYDVRSDIQDHNPRLLEYVRSGGTLLVQYNSGTTQFNSGHYTPYPATAGAERVPPPGRQQPDRVTDEEAPVQILAPEDAVLNFPNKIGAGDFQGWVQERGLYFMTKWDPRYAALLASHDPNEAPLKGGLLTARYGKGTYIYTGYSFFRQLPAGVPGAIRLFVNLLSAGHAQPATVAAQ